MGCVSWWTTAKSGSSFCEFGEKKNPAFFTPDLVFKNISVFIKWAVEGGGKNINK